METVEKTVFISYRRTNFPWARLIFEHLTQREFDVFLDYQSIPSGSFEQVIMENIRGRAHFLVLLSPSALDVNYEVRKEDWLKKEIVIALESRRNIVPIQLEGFEFESPIAQAFFTEDVGQIPKYQALRLINEYYDAGIDLLCERYLSQPLEAILHPVSDAVMDITEVQRNAAVLAPRVTTEELSAQEWFERGNKATDENEQIRYYSEAIRLDPGFGYAYYNRGTIYISLKQHDSLPDKRDV